MSSMKRIKVRNVLGKERRSDEEQGVICIKEAMVVPSDDELSVDVDKVPSTIAKHLDAPFVSVPLLTEDVDIEALSEDDWAFSSTLVGTFLLQMRRHQHLTQDPLTILQRPTQMSGRCV